MRIKFIITLMVCLLSASFSSDDAQNHFRLYISADVKGETEPCGWKKKPAGGLARKCTVVSNSIQEGFNTLILDAGNLFFKQDKIDPGVSLDVAKENANTIVSAFNYITCDGFSPGSKDFAAGVDYLKKLSTDSNFDFISCNIKDKDSQLLFKPYKIINKDGFRIGVVGASSIFESDGVVVDEPFSSIKKTISSIQEQCDFILLLFSSSDSDYKKINLSNLDIDFAVRSSTRRKTSDGGKNSYPIYSLGDRGKVLYQFDFKYNDLSQSLVDLAYFNKSIKLETKRMENISPDGDLSLKEKYRKNIIAYNSVINNAVNSLQVKQITLDKTIQDNPFVLKVVDEGKIKTRNLGGPLEDPHRWHNH